MIPSGDLSLATTGSPSGSDLSYDFLGEGPELPFEQFEHRARWNLVWCHERCRKQENQPWHDALTKLARDAGGMLFCVKKAKSFEAWRNRPRSHAPFILLTDGREVKPCMIEMARGSQRNRPLAIIVVSEHKRQSSRLAAWVKDIAAQGLHEPIHLVQDVGELFALLPALVYYTGCMAQISFPRRSAETAVISSPLAAECDVYSQQAFLARSSPYPYFPGSCAKATPPEATQAINLESGICSRFHF